MKRNLSLVSQYPTEWSWKYQVTYFISQETYSKRFINNNPVDLLLFYINYMY